MNIVQVGICTASTAGRSRVFRATEGLRGDRGRGKLGYPLAPLTSDAAQRVIPPPAGYMPGNHDDLLVLVCLFLVGCCSSAIADPSTASQQKARNEHGEDGRPLTARWSRH